MRQVVDVVGFEAALQTCFEVFPTVLLAHSVADPSLAEAVTVGVKQFSAAINH